MKKTNLFYPPAPGVGNPELSFEDRTHGMLVMGPRIDRINSTWMVPMVMQDIRDKDTGVIVFDTKADMAWAAALMAKETNRPYLLFDPSFSDCPSFNPLLGNEDDVVERMVNVYIEMNPDSPQYFKDLSEQVLRNAIKVLKRLDKAEGMDGHYSTLIWLERLLQNAGGQGRDLVQKFTKIRTAAEYDAKQNADIACWFFNEYFAERSKEYENSIGLRSFINKLNLNACLCRVLNPDTEKRERSQVDFSKILDEKGILCIALDNGKFRQAAHVIGQLLLDSLRVAIQDRHTNNQNAVYFSLSRSFLPLSFSDFMSEAQRGNTAVTVAVQCRDMLLYSRSTKQSKLVAESIVNNGRNLVLFGGSLPADDVRMSGIFVRNGEHDSDRLYDTKSEFMNRPFTSAACRFISDDCFQKPVAITPTKEQSDWGADVIEQARKWRRETCVSKPPAYVHTSENNKQRAGQVIWAGNDSFEDLSGS